MIFRLIRLTLVSLILIYLQGCTPRGENVHRDELIVFGTIVSITLYGVDEATAANVIQAVDLMFKRQHKDWHAWQKGQLTELNEAIADGRSMAVDASILHLIRLGQTFEQDSLGLFNPAIGNLLRLWGFQQDEAATGPPPAIENIQAWTSIHPSSLDLEIHGQTVRSRNANVSLDFGGFAKGYSVGQAVQLIEQQGIDNFVVNAGGDLCIRGKHGDRAWRIGIQHPGGAGVLARIALEGSACVFTSGNYERYFDYDGHRYHHILDPRSGYPATDSASVTVLSTDPTLADAAATAAFVAGPRQFEAVASHMGIKDILLIDNKGNAYITPRLRELVAFEQNLASIATVKIENRVF